MKKTAVKFYMSKQTEDFDPEVYAVFIEEVNPFDANLFDSYAHVGQHGQCHINYIKESTQATKEQYQKLYDELTNLIGYDLFVLNED
jgi:predicted DNA-binding WGR domain protein